MTIWKPVDNPSTKYFKYTQIIDYSNYMWVLTFMTTSKIVFNCYCNSCLQLLSTGRIRVMQVCEREDQDSP